MIQPEKGHPDLKPFADLRAFLARAGVNSRDWAQAQTMLDDQGSFLVFRGSATLAELSPEIKVGPRDVDVDLVGRLDPRCTTFSRVNHCLTICRFGLLSMHSGSDRPLSLMSTCRQEVCTISAVRIVVFPREVTTYLWDPFGGLTHLREEPARIVPLPVDVPRESSSVFAIPGVVSLALQLRAQITVAEVEDLTARTWGFDRAGFTQEMVAALKDRTCAQAAKLSDGQIKEFWEILKMLGFAEKFGLN